MVPAIATTMPSSFTFVPSAIDEISAIVTDRTEGFALVEDFFVVDAVDFDVFELVDVVFTLLAAGAGSAVATLWTAATT